MSAPVSRARLAAHGFAADLDSPWEGRIYRRPTPTTGYVPMSSPQRVPGRTQFGAGGWAGEVPQPIMHLANFALPAERGDYGTGAVELMGPAHAFLALLEFGPEARGTALFAAPGLPLPAASDFDRNALQKRLPGQGGYQRFCTVNGRALCLFVVLGSIRQAAALVPQIRSVISRIEVQPA